MNALFIHIPKTAGTSMDKSLGLLRVRFPSRFEANFKNEGQCSVGHLDVRKRCGIRRLNFVFAEIRLIGLYRIIFMLGKGTRSCSREV